MRWLKRLLIAVGAIALVAVVISLVAPNALRAGVSALVTVTNDVTNPIPTSVTNSYSNPIVVNFPSHLGVPPSKFVSLNCAKFTTGSRPVFLSSAQVYQCSDWFLNNVGGTGQDGYSVPSGYDLIITDIEVASSSLSGNGLLLNVATSAGSGQSTVLQDAGTSDSNGYGVFREHLITGFSCTALPALTLEVVGQSLAVSTPPSFNIQGYLVPAS